VIFIHLLRWHMLCLDVTYTSFSKIFIPMIKNYLKIAYRNLIRDKGFSLLNISGLAIGMASAVLIILWIQNEISYDRFHKNSDRLYQVWSSDVVGGSKTSSTVTPEIMAPGLAQDDPEIEQTSRITWGENYLFSTGAKSLKAFGNAVDPSFLTMFSYPLIQGDPKLVLSDPYSIVLTEHMAKAIFGNENPMGQVLRMDNTENYKVTGILKDLPVNSQFNFEYLWSYDYKTMKNYIDKDWTDVGIRTYVLLKPHTSFNAANAKIKNVIVAHSGGKAKTTLFLYPLSKLRLYSNFENGIPVGGRIERVKTFGLIAILILVIACINFMNLSTARSEKRAREVGIRKVVGALKSSLIGQFLAESIFISFIASAFALLIVQLSLPEFNQLMQTKLSIDFGNIYFWLASIGFIMFTGVLAGSYPAFFLSSFKPIFVLKGAFKKVNALVTPRKVLVILQFTFAIALIVCTIIVEEQIKFAQSREIGYNSKNLGYVNIEGDIYKNYSLIKNELLSSGAATSISLTQAPLTQNWSSGIGMKWKGMDPNMQIQINRYTENGDLVKTAGMQLVAGRDIDVADFPTDSAACLISESAAKAMGFKDPIGQIIFDDPINWHVVGVIKDFILESPYETIKPFMVKGSKYGGSVLHIRLNAQNSMAQNLKLSEKVFKKYNPVYPFEFHFEDQEYASKFNDEQLTGKLASLFAGLTIFISCLGLFGLATYMAENRAKEIGVRKILGASVSSIAGLLSKDFLKLVVASVFIATPIAWWSMSKWLEAYNYHIVISGWGFLAAGLAALAIACGSVSYQAIKAATANPSDTLRTE
jgi:putative ABC transport system permease protein